MMDLLVVGGSGFVGRAVLRELSRRGIKARATARERLSAIASLGHGAIRFDLHRDPVSVLSPGQETVVVHLAWAGLPNYGALGHLETELPAHMAFLGGLLDAGIRRLIVAGSCQEYGLQEGPLDDDAPTDPKTPYAVAKDTLRRWLAVRAAGAGVVWVWARLFYLYGSDQPERSLFGALRAAVERGEGSVALSGGEQLRDYLSIGEAARIVVELALLSEAAGVVNVCSGRPVSVRSLVEGWRATEGWPLELRFGELPYPDHEPMAFWGTRRRLRELGL